MGAAAGLTAPLHGCASFFPAWAFVLPTTLLRIPYSLVEALIWTSIVYWVVGLTASAGR